MKWESGIGRGRSVTAAAATAFVCLAALTGAAKPVPAFAGRAEAAGTISTIAGGLGGPAMATTVGISVCRVTSAGGSLYLADGDGVYRESPRGRLIPVAGTGIPFVAGGVPAHGLPGPVGSTWVDACYATLDGHGNLLLTDADNSFRPGKPDDILVMPPRAGTFYGKAMKAGFLYDVAGDGVQGPGASGVRATKTPLSGPISVIADANGNLVIADAGFHQHHGPTYASEIRVVAVTSGTFYGRAMTAGDIYTVAGFRTGHGHSGDGGPATMAALGNFIGNVQVDHSGNLVLADEVNNTIRVVAVRSGTFYGQAMTAGDIYTVAGDGTAGFSGDGGPATGAELSGPGGVAVDASGNLVAADGGNSRIRVVADRTGTFYDRAMTAGDIYTVAGNGTPGFSGDGGPATHALLMNPYCVGTDAAGNTVICDLNNERIRVVAKTSGTFYGQAMTAGHIYTVAGNGLQGYSGDCGPATQAELFSPMSVAADPHGNLVIDDNTNDRIRLVAVKTGTFYGQAMTAGDIYTVAGNGTLGFSGDGGPATSAALYNPGAVAVDSNGNLVIYDGNNLRIRLVAVKTGTFYGQAMKAGHIYTVAGNGTSVYNGDGGPATSAGLDLASPGGVAVGPAGNLVISDTYHGRLRVVAVKTGTFYGQAMKAGHIYTVAGNGTFGYSGDGGPATGAEFNQLQTVAADAAGNLVVLDQNNDRIRVVAESTGTYYGVPMTAGDVYTVAGDGKVGFSGDGGPATKAELDFPDGLAVTATGDLLTSEFTNSRIRMVTGGPTGQPRHVR